jgi:hypothetical protein
VKYSRYDFAGHPTYGLLIAQIIRPGEPILTGHTHLLREDNVERISAGIETVLMFVLESVRALLVVTW